ncbi:HDOD domain-containing protein [Ideonella sp. 4Y16]|uniref:HDOD domain-containing protein n=1 Tax=Ideonella alba TaxID=2824118 RepID=A0A940YMA9_9BURK|nr:HDOD domain-containing protein [Ideonella alba]MBQ0932384.1 HDOD domain-containing protein [Ideonella alba]MBQ0942759.1 HDOD domain-containing protein [Ideonella alba]
MPADTLTTAPPRHGMRRIQVELDQARDGGPLKTIVIPPCPALLQRLRDTMGEAEPDLTEVGRIVGSDVAMSAALIKVANSPAYLTGQPVQTIGQAMNRLGLERTATEMAAFLLQRSLPANSPHLKRFWERAAKRASAMGFIARRLPGMSADLAHTYGLFCHVGTPVMLQSLKGYGSTMVEAAARIDRPYVATENANHRTDHAVVGALVARVWRLAPEVMAAIRRHHDLDMLGSEDTESEVHTLVAAGLVAEHLMRRHEGLDPDADWSAHHGAALRWLAIDEDELATWDDELRTLLDAA